MLKSNITVRIVRLTVILLGLLVLELIERPSYVNNLQQNQQFMCKQKQLTNHSSATEREIAEE